MPPSRSGKPAKQRPLLTFRPRVQQEDIARWIEDHKAQGDLPTATAMAIRLHMFMEQHQSGRDQTDTPNPVTGHLLAAVEPLIPRLASALAEELLRRMPKLTAPTDTVQDQDSTRIPSSAGDNNDRSAVLQERFMASSGLLDDDDE